MGCVSIASGGKVLTVGGGGVVRAVASGGTKTVLTQSDFTYAGYYEINLGGEFCFGQSLAYRYNHDRIFVWDVA